MCLILGGYVHHGINYMLDLMLNIKSVTLSTACAQTLVRNGEEIKTSVCSVNRTGHIRANERVETLAKAAHTCIGSDPVKITPLAYLSVCSEKYPTTR